MGQLNLSQLNTLPDVLKNSKWNVRFSKMPAVSGITSTDIDLRTVTMDVPKATTNIMEVTIREHSLRLPGRLTYPQTITLNCIETVDTKTLQFIKDWRELCAAYDTHKVASRAEREAEILLYACDDQWNDVWTWKIHRAWLTDYTVPQLTNDNPSAMQLSLVLAMTSFEENSI